MLSDDMDSVVFVLFVVLDNDHAWWFSVFGLDDILGRKVVDDDRA